MELFYDVFVLCFNSGCKKKTFKFFMLHVWRCVLCVFFFPPFIQLLLPLLRLSCMHRAHTSSFHSGLRACVSVCECVWLCQQLALSMCECFCHCCTHLFICASCCFSYNSNVVYDELRPVQTTMSMPLRWSAKQQNTHTVQSHKAIYEPWCWWSALALVQWINVEKFIFTHT